MCNKPIELLPINERRVLKTISIARNIGHRLFQGKIVYGRRLSETYRFTETNREERISSLFHGIKQESFPHDNWDNMIFDTVRLQYPDAELTNKLILFDVEEETVRRLYVASHHYTAKFAFLLNGETLQEGERITNFSVALHIFPLHGDEEGFADEEFSMNYNAQHEEEMRAWEVFLQSLILI